MKKYLTLKNMAALATIALAVFAFIDVYKRLNKKDETQ